MATHTISPTKFGPLDFKDIWLWLDPSDTHANYNFYDTEEDEYFWKDKSYVNQWTSYWDVATARPDSTINGLTVMDFGDEGDIEVEGPEGITEIPQSGTTTFFFLLQMDAADDDYIVFHDSSTWERYFLKGETGSTDAPHINAGSPTYWVDGVQQSWTTADDVYTGLGSTVRIVMVENVDLFAQDTSQDPVSDQWAWLSIGAWDADEHTDNMKMGEVIALPGTLTQTERQDVEGYLAWKWGKQADLPAGHPWLNQAPTAYRSPKPATLITLPEIEYDTNIGTGGAAPGGAGRFSPYDQTSEILLMVDHEDAAASDALPRLAEWAALDQHYLVIDGVDTEVTLNSFTSRSDRYDLNLARTAQLWTDISTATTLSLQTNPAPQPAGVINYDISGDTSNFELWLDASDASTITEESGAVSQINDKSGNNRHVVQSDSAARPVVVSGEHNGLDTVRFGAGIWMDGRGAPTFFPIANRAYYFAIKPRGGTDSDTLFSFVSAGSGESYGRHNGMEFYSANSGGNVATISGGFEFAYDDGYTWGPWPCGFIYLIDGGTKTYHRVTWRSTSIAQDILSGTTSVAESSTVHEGLMLGAVLKSNNVDEKNAQFDLCELIVTTDTSRETGYRIQRYLYEKWHRSDYQGFVSRWGQRANIDNWNYRVPATKSTDDEIQIRISSSGEGYPPLPNQGQIFPYH